MTTTTIASSHAPARSAASASTTPATKDAPFPTGLVLLLAVFGVLAINIAVVLYMAAQMP